MKIDSGIKSVGSPGTTARSAPAATPVQQSPANGATQVAISSLSARLQEITAGMGNEAPVDAARIAEIKQAITEGRFTVNPERIADGLLRDVRQMLDQRRQ